MSYFRQGQILQLRLVYKDVSEMDSLESIASCDMEFGLISKLNKKMKVYE